MSSKRWIDAWETEPPPADFASKVMAAYEAEASDPPRTAPTSPPKHRGKTSAAGRSRGALLGASIAAIAMAAAWFVWMRRADDAGHTVAPVAAERGEDPSRAETPAAGVTSQTAPPDGPPVASSGVRAEASNGPSPTLVPPVPSTERGKPAPSGEVASRPCALGDPQCQPTSAASPGESLGMSDIEGVVRRNRNDVKRQCWSALTPPADARARVNVGLTILPSGAVSAVSASGGEGFPSLVPCVTGRVRTWRFPRSDGETRVNIPFVFAGS